MWQTELAGIAATGVTADSREVKPGMVFVALSGTQTDGNRYIADAIAKGAVAVVTAEDSSPASRRGDCALIHHPNPRLALSELARSFFPEQPETMVAITGTDGKTSVAHFCRELWRKLGHNAASLGTLGVVVGDDHLPLSHTTPDPVALHRALQMLAQRHVTHAAMESSSIGLDQHRMDAVTIRAAALTNLTRDHLDYHGDAEHYRDAKLTLFHRLLPTDGTAVLPVEDAAFDAFRAACGTRRILTFSREGNPADIRLLSSRPTPEGIACEVEAMGHRATLAVPLVGQFQLWNLLTATGLLIACGESPERILPLWEQIPGVRGRMERVSAGVYVDYAHTPNALANVLRSLRPHVTGALHVVFGCGGNRDAGKRPEMGRIASQLADRVIVTDDNPRHEDAATIRQQILAAAPGAIEIADRKEAIQTAIRSLRSGDALLIAGKGHETGQIIGDEVHPFDDTAVAREQGSESPLPIPPPQAGEGTGCHNAPNHQRLFEREATPPVPSPAKRGRDREGVLGTESRILNPESCPRAILFDWDNTLVDSWDTIHQSLHDTFVTMGRTPWTMEEVRVKSRLSLRDAFPAIFGDQCEEASNLYRNAFASRHLEWLKALPQAEETLKRIQDAGIFCAVVSNKTGGFLRKEVAALGWDRYFSALVGATDAARDKPAAEPALMALAVGGLPPSPAVWLVGDSVTDLECAQNAGLTAILYGPDALVAEEKASGFPFAHHTQTHAMFQALFEGLQCAEK
jgi:UDP-N-acetylmuramoyl-L-alanyl-D-glutamate--2,6-diaminopimelate ligase